MSRLIWIFAVCKCLLLSPVAVKELTESDVIQNDNACVFYSEVNALAASDRCYNQAVSLQVNDQSELIEISVFADNFCTLPGWFELNSPIEALI